MFPGLERRNPVEVEVTGTVKKIWDLGRGRACEAVKAGGGLPGGVDRPPGVALRAPAFDGPAKNGFFLPEYKYFYPKRKYH